MNTFDKISPDDPRLTTYALGEMEPAERAEFEQLLQQDPAARAIVDAINGTAHSIGVALASEPLPQTEAAAVGQAAIIAGRDLRKLDGGPLPGDHVPELRRGLAKLLRFPQMYFTISSLAAACFALGFFLWEAGYWQQPQRHYTEIDLSKFASADATKAKVAAAPAPAQSVAAETSANRDADAEPALEVGLQPAARDRT